MTDRRPLLRALYDAAVAAAHPSTILAPHLRPAPRGRVICLAAGKGAAAMAAAAERHYLDTLGLAPERLVGIATTRHGYGVAQTLVQVLKQCGDDLTRANVMKQAASLKNFRTEVLLPGVQINTSPTDFAPISQLQLEKFKGDKWELFGDVISADVGG